MRAATNCLAFFGATALAFFILTSMSFASHCTQESERRSRELDTTWAAALKRADQIDAARLPMKDAALCKALMRHLGSIEGIVRHLQERPSCFHDAGERNIALQKMNELLRSRRSLVPKSC
ncbi:MAG: hypothetical protein WD073_07700 [Xanthobacteraceae bacterium]